MLNGGAGDDVFMFSTVGFGHDRVQNFDLQPEVGNDLLDISGLGVTADNFASRVIIIDAGADTLISIGEDSIRLLGIDDATTVTINAFHLSTKTKGC